MEVGWGPPVLGVRAALVLLAKKATLILYPRPSHKEGKEEGLALFLGRRSWYCVR